MNKILILGSVGYRTPFMHYGETECVSSMNVNLNEVKEYDLIVFTGGEDVHPSVYNREVHKRTFSNYDRDKREMDIYTIALSEGIPMVGICRGSQFLTVMNGGELIQDISNHIGNHCIFIDKKGESKITVTSTHHQMMHPKIDSVHDILAYSLGRSDYYDLGGEDKIDLIVDKDTGLIVEPEVVYYKESRCLAVQFHPEYMESFTDGARYFDKLLKMFSLSGGKWE